MTAIATINPALANLASPDVTGRLAKRELIALFVQAIENSVEDEKRQLAAFPVNGRVESELTQDAKRAAAMLDRYDQLIEHCETALFSTWAGSSEPLVAMVGNALMAGDFTPVVEWIEGTAPVEPIEDEEEEEDMDVASALAD